MLAARDQENLIYKHQTTAVNKPFNQGIGGLQRQTPAQNQGKTPFKLALNDENKFAANGRIGAKGLDKGNENRGPKAESKGGKNGGDAFVTPSGRHRPRGYETIHIAESCVQHHATALPWEQKRPMQRPAWVRRWVCRLRQ